MADIFEDGFVDTSQHTYRDFSVPNTDPFGVSIFANTDSDGVPTSYSYSFNQAYAFNAAISGDLNRASGVISGMEDSFTVPVGEDVEFKVGLKINKQNFIIQDAVFYTGEPSQEGEDLSSGLYPIFGYKSEDNDEGKIYTGIYQICTVRDGSVITRTTRDNIYLDNIQIKQLGTTGAPTNGEGGQVHLIQESGQYDSSVPILFRGISGGSGVQVTYDSTNASGGNFIVIDSTGSAGGGATPNYTNLGFGADVYDESSSSPNADFRSLTGAHRTESLDATKIYVTQDTNVIRFSGQAVRLSNTGNIGSSVKLYVDSPETGPATESKAAFREIYSDDSSIDIGLVNSNNTIDIGFNSGKYKPYYNWTGENIGAHGENVYKNTTGPASNTKAQFHKISGVTVNQGDNTESSQKASVNVATSDNVIKISVDLSTAQAAGAQEPYLGQSSLPTGSFIAGGTGNAISGHYNVISAGALNKISGGQINFIGGGSGNDVNFSRFSSSLGGRNNDVSGADFSVILGGNTNLVTGGNAHVIGGGDNNQISGDNSEIASTIVGGTFNKILGNTYSFIGAGGTNTIYANNSVINGGTNNIASGNSSVVFGGSNNKVLADYGVAAGRYSKVQATHNGAFVLSDSNTSETLSSGANTLTLNFKSGVYVDSDSGIYINGNPVLTGVSGSEGDTLQIVTDRGATTTNAITLQNSLTLSYNYPRINLTDTDNNSDYSILNNDGSFGIYDVTNSAYRLQILSGGNVGIGAVTPLSRLHIGNATGSTLGLRFTNPTETVNQYFADDSTDSDFFITYAGNGGAEITLQHDGKLALNASNGDNVGVGTDNPRTSLHVSRAGTTEGGIITIDNPNNTDGSYCGIEFINSTVGYPRSAIFAQRTGGYDAELTFHTSPTNEITGSDYPAATERMRIDHDGNVGIGTNSPSGFSSSARRLVIGEGAASEGMSIFAGTSSNASIYFADGAAGSAAYQGFVQYKHGDSRMDFGAAGGRRMIMNGNGLLIAPNGGVFSPSAELEIASSAATLRLTDTDLTNHYSEIEKAGVYTYLSSRANAADGGFIFFGGGTDTEFMRIETDGKVGIGSASPSFVLDTVFAGDNGARLRSTDNHSSLTVQSHASYGAYLRFSDGGNRYWLQARSDDKLQFRPNASLLESACIYFDETGNVGIGVLSPTEKLEVGTDTDVSAVIGKAHVGYMGQADSAFFGHVDFATTSNYAMKQNSAGNTMINVKAGGSIGFNIANATKAAINNGGDFFVDTDTLFVDASADRVGINDSTPSYALDVNGVIRTQGDNKGGGLLGTQFSNIPCTTIDGFFASTSTEDYGFQNALLMNDLAGFTKWAGVTIKTSGLYKARSGSAGSYTYGDEAGTGDFDRAFQANNHTVGSWYTDSGPDGDITTGAANSGSIELYFNGVKSLNYSAQAAVLFGSAAFRATHVKIEAHRTGAWQTILDETGNSKTALIARIASNGGGANATTGLRYTFARAGSYFRINNFYAADYDLGNDLSYGGQYYIDKYYDGRHYSTLYPVTNGGADLGKSSNKYDVIYGNSGNFTNGITIDGNPVVTGSSAEDSDTLQTVTDRGSTTTNNIEIQGAGTKSLTVDSTNGHASVIIDRHSSSYDANLMFQTNGATHWRLWNDSNDSTLSIRDEANASNVMTWEVGGNVGIGTDDPDGKLHIETAASSQTASTQADELIVENSTHGGISILTPDASRAHLYFNQGAFLRWQSSLLTIDTSNSAHHLALKAGGGNVGIGTTAPAQLLDVYGSESKIALTSSAGRNTVLQQGGGHFHIKTSHTNGVAINNNESSAGRLAIYSGTAENIRFASNGDSWITGGDVGIGTTAPQETLHVYSTSNSRVEVEATTEFAALKATNNQGSYGWYVHNTTDSFRLFDFGASTDYITVSGNGNVGIGITNPSAKLHIDGGLIVSGTSTTGINIVGESNYYTTIIGNDESHPTQSLAGGRIIGPAARRLYFELLGNDATDHFRFLTSPNNDQAADNVALHIGNDGDVGIGTASPISRLNIKSSATSSEDSALSITQNGGANTIFAVGERATNGAQMLLYDGGTATHAFYTDGTDNYINAGNVGIGVTSPSQKLEIIADATALADQPAEPLFVHNNGNNIDGRVFLSVKHDRISTASALGAGLKMTAGAVTAGTASYFDSLIFLEGAQAGSDTIHSAPKAIKFYVDNHGTAAGDGTDYTQLGDLRLTIAEDGNIGIGDATPIGDLQIGTNVFSGANGVHADDRIGLSVNGSLKSMVYASTYNNATFPDYGMVFIHGPNTGDYNVWSISPDGPAKGSGLNFIYRKDATNIHTTAPLVYFNGDGAVGIGTTEPAQKFHVAGGNILVDSQYGIRFNDYNTRIYTNSETPEDLLIEADQDLHLDPDGVVKVDTAEFQITSSAAYTTHLNYNNAGNNFISQANGGATQFRNSAGTLMSLNSVGTLNVGAAGVTNTRLHVTGAASDSLARFKDGDDGVEFTTRLLGRQQIDFLGTNTSAINAKGSLHINYDTNNDGTNDSIIFARNSGDEAGTVDMIITEGKVGINDTSPANMLSVSGDASSQIAVAKITRQQASASNATYTFEVDSSAHTSNMTAAGAMAVDVNAGRAFTINGNGSVGIGTTGPQSKLHVGGGDIRIDNNQQYLAETAGGGVIGVAKMDVSDNLLIGDGNFVIDVNGSSERMKINSAGNVLIGQPTDSVDKLQTQGEANLYAARFNGSTNGSQSYGVRIRAGTTSVDQGFLVENTAGTDLFIVKGNGNVGIGTGSPSNALDVVGHFSATSKSFLIDHPTKENKKLQYGSLEGPENGVYVRGTTHEDSVELPEYWSELVHDESITVVLTPIGKKQDLFIIKKSNKLIKIGGVEGSYDYVVYGERKDIDRLEVEPDGN
jgi:hypothetical protein